MQAPLFPRVAWRISGQTYDRDADYWQGFEDAVNGFPRESTRPAYRGGYDRGIRAAIEQEAS